MNTNTALLNHLAGWTRSATAALSIVAAAASYTPTHAAETTLAEMLELGIYSEETKGDVAGAIQLYEQILAEAAADRGVAAQALFRLALCHHKQGDHARATAAFEKLVGSYADQKELVALANDYLAAGTMLLPVPWTDGEEMEFEVRLPNGQKIGAGRYLVRAAERDGRKIWQFQTQLLAGGYQWSRIDVDADTFRPLHCVWKITGIGEAETTYTGTGADVRTVGKEDVKHVELTGAVYDNEQAAQLIRRLPLAPGYKTTLRVFTGLGGCTLLPVPMSVTGIEKVTVPAGEMECFRTVLKVGANEQVFWYSNDAHRYLVKFEVNGVRVELNRVATVPAGQPVVHVDQAQRFTIEAPAGWMFSRREAPTETASSTLLVLDTEAAAITQLEVKAASQLEETARTSPRAWADQQIAKGSQRLKSFTVREGSWREFSLNGGPAVSFTADIVQMSAPEVMHAVYSLAGDRAVAAWFVADPDKFEAFEPRFNSVIQSLALN